MLNMDRLKARLLRGSVLEIFGLEEKLKGLKQKILSGPFAPKAAAALQEAPKPAAAKTTAPIKSTAKSPSKPKKRSRPAAAESSAPSADPLATVMSALESHPQKEVLLRAGQQKDQLLRSLVPLYLVPEGQVEITSGVISAFWKEHGVKYAAPNAAKALREHVGYARATKLGRQITPHGVQYVEAALAQLAA